jgi:hypothetical protein
MALGEDLTALWNHPEAPTPLKKRILRTVLTEIVSTVTRIHLHIDFTSTGLVAFIRNCEWSVTRRDSIGIVQTAL